MFVSVTETIAGAGNTDVLREKDKRCKEVIFQNCAPFTEFRSEINNTQIHGKDVVIPMYNLEYSDNYFKTSGCFWKYFRDKPALKVGCNFVDLPCNFASFKLKLKIKERTPDAVNVKHVKTAVALKHLSNFWRTLEISLINCEINLILTGHNLSHTKNFISAGLNLINSE